MFVEPRWNSGEYSGGCHKSPAARLVNPGSNGFVRCKLWVHSQNILTIQLLLYSLTPDSCRTPPTATPPTVQTGKYKSLPVAPWFFSSILHTNNPKCDLFTFADLCCVNFLMCLTNSTTEGSSSQTFFCSAPYLNTTVAPVFTTKLIFWWIWNFTTFWSSVNCTDPTKFFHVLPVWVCRSQSQKRAY